MTNLWLTYVVLFLCVGWLGILGLHHPWWHELVTCAAAYGIYICSGIIFDYYKSKRTEGISSSSTNFTR